MRARVVGALLRGQTHPLRLGAWRLRKLTATQGALYIAHISSWWRHNRMLCQAHIVRIAIVPAALAVCAS